MPNSRGTARHWRGAFLGAIAALLVSACGVVAITSHFAPSYVYWRLDQALDFDAAQANDVRARLERLHVWHRRSELADYSRLLSEVQERVGRAVSAAEVTWLHEEIRERLKRFFGRWEDGRTMPYADYAERNRAALHRFYAEATNLATPEQRARARRELQHYIDEIAALPPRTASRASAPAESHARSLEQSALPRRP